MPRSYKHSKTDKRAHIPSREEAGYERDSPKVREREVLDLPKNPVVHRGQDPELFWLGKYGEDPSGGPGSEAGDRLKVDIRSLYRHEHIAPEKLIDGLHRIVVEKKNEDQMEMFSVNETFGNALERDELEKPSSYYQWSDGWTNRLIQGDSLLTMTSLLEREGMASRMQMIYIDPPYGINYASNWQNKVSDKLVKENDENLSGDPDVIKAFRDTWVLGIHSYLSYLRDRLLVAKELLSESGSCFVQINDENAHLVRNVMEEVFGSENFCGQITFRTKLMPLGSKTLEPICDFIIWYCKSKEHVKFRDVFTTDSPEGNSRWGWVELPDKVRRKMSHEELNNHRLLPSGSRVFTMQPMRPAQYRQNCDFPVVIDGQTYRPAPGSSWSTTEEGMKALVNLNRVVPSGKNLFYVLYHDDYPVGKVNALWADTGPAMSKSYVVQSSNKVIERCMLMCSDPGDLVLDPTCGSGTTAFVAEQWGRRWITIDTSRIALNIAKTRLMTASFPNYHLHSDVDVRTDMKDGKFKKTITEKKQLVGDVRQGFVYEEVPHITLKSVANDEPPATETLYDKPYVDNKRVRVSGPFTVETLQDFEPVSPAELEERSRTGVDDVPFEQRVFAHLQSAGVLNGIKNERAIFTRVDRLASAYLHAEGFYKGKEGEKKAYFHIGPKFGSVSRLAVNEAVKECRQRGDADWLVILGFSFETDIESKEVTASTGSFMVTKTRMHDDLMQEGLMKKPKNVGSFITIGEPDVRLNDCTPPAHVIASGALAAKRSPATDKGIASSKTPRDDGKVRWVQVEVAGLDIYDPISDTVKARNVEDIAYWMVDDDYDGSNFVVKQVFFCGGDKDEFAKWQRGLSDLSKQSTKRKAELTLKIELDDEAFDRLYGHISHPIAARKGQKIAVRVVSQFGEESTKVVGV